MRNLLAFLIRYNAFLLFVVLQVVCFILIIQNNNYHRAGFINSSNTVIGAVYEKVNGFRDYLSLKKENELLANEHAFLRNALASSFYSDSIKQTNVSDSAAHQMYNYVAADVINITVNKANNYITINKGSLAGIKPHMAVIGPNGVVGVVKDVSTHFSTIMSMLHSDTRISGRVGNPGWLGTVIWTGGGADVAEMTDVPKQANVKPGDKIFTSGASVKFPRGILIGTVQHAELKEGNNFYEITVKLATDFTSVQYVYVVNYLMQTEQENLEAQENDQ